MKMKLTAMLKAVENIKNIQSDTDDDIFAKYFRGALNE